MFRQPPPGPQPKWKRPLYLTLTTVLGLIISFGLHAVIELMYLRWAESQHAVITWTNVLGLCALPLWVQFVLPILGVVGGFVIGRVWWRIVYIERQLMNHKKP